MKISSGLAEGQVLQRLGARGASAEISGVCAESGTVSVTIGSRKGALKGWKNREAGSAGRGKFSVTIKGIPAGGPYRLELRCNKGVARIREFFVGDVWALAGQSNMEGVGNMEDAPKPHPLIRNFTMRREWIRAAEPLHVKAESPDFCHNGGVQCTPEEAKRQRRAAAKGVGPGLWFAHEMLRRTGVPQGLICAAHGGSSMLEWIPLRERDGRTSYYGSLTDSIEATGQRVAGVLWYQGESDAGPQTVPLYTGRMKKLVESLRRDLRLPGLPWITVQIGRVFGARQPADEMPWNQIQDLQRLLPRVIKNLGVVTAIDLSMDDFIHVSGKGHALLGARLAREAARLALGDRKEKAPPRLRSVSLFKFDYAIPQLTSQVMEVIFDDVVGGLQAAGEPCGFAVVDHEGRDLRAIFKTTLHGNSARLHVHGANLSRVRVCYGLGTTPICNITDGRGHGLPVFGPQQVGQSQAWLPFVTGWKVTPPIESPRTLDEIGVPDVDALGGEVRSYEENDASLEGFINEHPRWAGNRGHCYFASRLELAEPMRLEFRMGYDGPFRLWLDGKEFFINMKGTNPCFADESCVAARLSAGSHEITVGMDLNAGAAWGFFLRFIRKDVSAAQVKAGAYAQPVYGL